MCSWGRSQWRPPPAPRWRSPSRARVCPSRPPPASAPPTCPSPWVSPSMRPQWMDVPARYAALFTSCIMSIHAYRHLAKVITSHGSAQTEHMGIISVQLPSRCWQCMDLFFISLCWGSGEVLCFLTDGRNEVWLRWKPKSFHHVCVQSTWMTSGVIILPAEFSQVGNRKQDQLWTDFTERRRAQDGVDPRADQWRRADSGNH